MNVRRNRVKCLGTAKHVAENLDRLLGHRAYLRIRKHLDRCPDCTAYLDSLKTVVWLYKHYTDPAVPSRTHKRLFALLRVIQQSRC